MLQGCFVTGQGWAKVDKLTRVQGYDVWKVKNGYGLHDGMLTP